MRDCIYGHTRLTLFKLGGKGGEAPWANRSLPEEMGLLGCFAPAVVTAEGGTAGRIGFGYGPGKEEFSASCFLIEANVLAFCENSSWDFFACLQILAYLCLVRLASNHCAF